MIVAAPVIDAIPADIHLRAQALGYIAETYAETYAGRVTGRVAWRLVIVQWAPGGWTDTVSMRSGAVSRALYARAELRHALDDLEIEARS